jgi:CheY-like chemotaxis protein
MLVEDDKSLREIYGVRLLAEGYDIVSAGDGEEALAMAIKERPQLIVSDVMMPKISGFDMLDILHSTTETKNIKVIMMTALSTEEQRQRGEALGADRYLVKSQVGIEDVVRVVHEVLEDRPAAAPAPTAAPTVTPAAQPAPAPAPVTPQPAPAVPPRAPAAPASATIAPQPAAPAPTAARPAPTPKPASIKTRVIQPLNDPTTGGIDLNELLDKEIAKEAGITEDARPPVATTNQEKELVEKQISSFTPPAAPTAEGIPGIEITSDGTITPDAPVDNVGGSTLPTPGVIPPKPPTPPAAPQQ